VKTIIFDIDGVLLLGHRKTALGSIAAALRIAFNIIIVTGRPCDEQTVLEMKALGLGSCPLHTLPAGAKANAWKVETICRLAREHEVAAVFEDSPAVLKALSQKRIPIVPVFSGYYG
jgi:hypothetical protein